MTVYKPKERNDRNRPEETDCLNRQQNYRIRINDPNIEKDPFK